jgi:uncharacterized membrane protein YeaQ/YmgE (transglycosylase-associated protein family)
MVVYRLGRHFGIFVRESCDVAGVAITTPQRDWSKPMDFVWFIVIGIVAGFLAGVIMKGGGYGIIGDLILGVLGALLGGFLFGLLGITSGGLIGSLITATIGAIVLIAIVRLIKRR